ncbi:MAG: hypothetical protein HFF50_09900 [Lawsonibacter sp.]|nr:hypothetical protein [Lawsonibacter sp.]
MTRGALHLKRALAALAIGGILLSTPLVPGLMAFWCDGRSVLEIFFDPSGDGLFWGFVVFLGAYLYVFQDPTTPVATGSFLLWGGEIATILFLWRVRQRLGQQLEKQTGWWDEAGLGQANEREGRKS